MSGERFSGRAAELRQLDRRLQIAAAGGVGNPGRAVILTGRRRVGKSLLAQEFCDRADVPYLIFQATRGKQPAAERTDLITAITESSLPSPRLLESVHPTDWRTALSALADAVPTDRPSIVVIDEVPWIIEQDAVFEGELQTVWDRELSRKPVLLLLIGSDLSVMEALQTYERPFFGRATPMVLQPLTPADVQDLTSLSAAEALDAHLITGGLPEVVRSWQPGMDRNAFLEDSLQDPLSPLLAAGAITLLGEFPVSSHSRRILTAIGSGERTFSAIAAAVGSSDRLPSGTLNPLLKTLLAKGIIATDTPMSTKPDTKNRRYRISDSYLRFWLALLDRSIPLVERQRGGVALERIERSWPAWRGRAVEPLIRESLLRLLPDDDWPGTYEIGSWWNRQNNPEIDLVGADKAPVAKQVTFVGSVKWYENKPFGRHDYDELVRSAVAVPGTDPHTPLVAVSRTPPEPGLHLARTWGPEELVAGWR